jgi:hypothetical protein
VHVTKSQWSSDHTRRVVIAMDGIEVPEWSSVGLGAFMFDNGHEHIGFGPRAQQHYTFMLTYESR